jgi:hypothetical protein
MALLLALRLTCTTPLLHLSMQIIFPMGVAGPFLLTTLGNKVSIFGHHSQLHDDNDSPTSVVVFFSSFYRGPVYLFGFLFFASHEERSRYPGSQFDRRLSAQVIRTVARRIRKLNERDVTFDHPRLLCIFL